MAWSAADIPDLTGRVAVITGANSGLGLETTKALAGAGATVVMAVRDQTRAERAEGEIVSAHPGASTSIVPLDLGSLDSVAETADAVLAAHSHVDILVNNAGVMAMPERRTVDGFELQFGVDHLGHWALTARLMPALVAAGPSRVVTVTSTARHLGRPLDPANPHLEGNYDAWRSYGQAKMANYLFAIGLQREFERRGLSASSLPAHPGLSHTDLQVRTAAEGGTGSGRFWKWAAATAGMSPDRGALAQLRAATDPDARGGDLYTPRFVNFGDPVRRPVLRRGLDEEIATLWEVSERETGLGLFDLVDVS